MSDILDIYIGWDSREPEAFDVCRGSLERRTSKPLHIVPLMERPLRYNNQYWRAHRKENGQLWDVISGAPMSTEFAITRFVPICTHDRGGWILVMDSDMLAMADVAELFDLADPRYAAMCVKHRYLPDNKTKMDGQRNVQYPRKNWSSLVLYNLDHEANKRLTLEMVNTLPGRDLHRFCWLEDEEIGPLPFSWNYLVGHTETRLRPKMIHYTDGLPIFEGYEDKAFAAEWLAERKILDAIHERHRNYRRYA
jgi:hypothetical protein